MTDKELESKTIDWLRFPMAFAVVLLHTGSQGGNSNYPIYSTLCILLPNGLCRIAVPMFFLFSGYLFFRGINKWDLRLIINKISKRFKTLLLPYLLWNLLAAVLLFNYDNFRYKLNGLMPLSIKEALCRWQGIRLFWDCYDGLPIDYPLWFVRNLFIFILCTPIIFLFIKYLKTWAIVLLLILDLLFGSFLEGLFFFTLGGFLSMNGKSIISLSNTHTRTVLIGSLILLLLLSVFYRHNLTAYGLLRRLFVVTGSFAIFHLASKGIETNKLRVNKLLSKSSFFIFAAHGIIILHDISHYIIYHTLPLKGEAYHCVDLFVRPCLAVSICIALLLIMEKLIPKTLGLLTGGRVFISNHPY
jgi:surface polysaccharide O-acyltransferase-like enzyme